MNRNHVSALSSVALLLIGSAAMNAQSGIRVTDPDANIKMVPDLSGEAAERISRLLSQSNALRSLTITNDSWNGGTGNWSVAANWTAGVPTSGNDVFITTSAPSTVTLDINGQTYNLTISSNGTLNINNNETLKIFGPTISNAGTISLNSAGNYTALILGAPNTTLNGGGTVTMSNSSGNVITGMATTDILTNQETIEGSGSVGGAQMTLSNSGTINANRPTELTIAANGGTTNTGLLEATNGGTLGFSGTVVTNTNGTINTSNGSIHGVSSTINGGTVMLAGGGLSNTTFSGANVTVSGGSDLQLYNGSFTGGTLNNSAEIETMNGSFGNAVGGTVTNTSTGLIQIDNNTGLTLQSGTYSNLGTISLNSAGNTTELVIGASNITLGGTGKVIMSNSSGNYILGSSTADTLTNQETIQGAGNIGGSRMTLVNSGTINADQPVELTIAANGGTTNTGLLEATNDGTLGFSGTVVTNTNGTINTIGGSIDGVSSTINGGTITLAGGGLTNTTINSANVTVQGTSDLRLYNGLLTNGTLSNSAELETQNGSFGNAIGGTVKNTSTGLIQIDNNTGLTLQTGTYTNAGTISLNSAGNVTELVIDASNITLGGGGKIAMSNSSANYILGSSTADTLTNQETISGAGNIGDNQMTLVNSGTINANQPVGLTIEANGGTTNTGTLEATNGGTLGFSGTIVTNTNGTISTSSGSIDGVSSTINGGTVALAGGGLSNTTINGAKVTVTGTSDLQLYNGSFTNGALNNSAQLETQNGSFGNAIGGTVTNTSTGLIRIDNNTGLTLQSGTYSNAGTISLNSVGNATELVIGASNITLGGGGNITMSNSAANYIIGAATADTLTNQEIISGAGNIGDAQMTLVNSGTINANQPAGLTIAANGGTTNSGLLEATNGGTLGFSGTVVTNSGTINTAGGSIDGVSSTINGGTVELAGGSLSNAAFNKASVIVGGTSDLTLYNGSFTNGSLHNSAQLETVNGSFGNTIGGIFTNVQGGLVRIDNNSGLTLQSGTYANAGTISLNSVGNATELVIDASNLTLGGGGNITMSNSSANYILGSATADTLTNQETISGAGNIGDGAMTLVNSSTINANQAAELTIAANGGTTNSGLLEATNGGTLGFSGTIVTNTGTINTSGGSIDGVSSTINGGTVTLASGGLSNTTINGANVTVAGSKSLELYNGSFTNGTLVNSAEIQTQNGSFGNTLSGTVTNTAGGAIRIENNTGLTLQAGTYGNAGTIVMNSAGNNTQLVIDAANITLGGGGNIIMSNNAANTITGEATADTLTNQDTISGAGKIGAGKMTLVNAGVIDSNQTAGITIDANGGFTNTGALTAGSGSTLAITTDTLFKNFSGTTLTGGTYNVAGIFQFGASGTSLVTNAANITLSGIDSAIEDAAGNNVLKLFANNAAGASFTLAGSRNFTTAGNFTNNGSLTVGTGSKFSVNGALTNLSGTTLTGGSYNIAGTLQFGVAGTTVVTNASNIALNGTSAQIIDAASNNILKPFANNSAAGSFTLAGGSNFTTAGNFTNNGGLNIGAGSAFSVSGGLTNFNSGTLTGGTYNVGGTLQFNGANIVTNAAAVTLNGTASKITDQTGTANALANFAKNTSAGIFTLAGNQNLTVGGNFTNAGTLTVGSGSTFALNNSGTFTQTGGSTTVDGTLKSSVNTAALNLNSGSLFGTGTLGFSVVNSSVLTPANSSSSTSLLAVSGSYQQGSSGVLDIAIAGTTPGTKYDQLKVSGAATVGGTLNLSLLGGYVPAVGTVFDILTSSSISGSFATVNGAINGSEHFSVTCTAGNCDATVVSGAALKSSLVSMLAPLTLAPRISTTLPAVPLSYPLITFRPANVPASFAPGNPFRAGNGQKYKGVQMGVDLLTLLKTSPRSMLKAFTGSAYVPPVGYLSSMTY